MNRFGFIYLGIFFFIISIFSFFNIIYSYYFNLYLNIDAYVYSLIISLLLGTSLFFNIKKDIKISIYEKIVVVLTGYIVIPLLIAVPFFLSIYNISFLDCYFEAVSGFTSTGFSIFSNIKHLDESLILWRSTSQWIGGIYFLFSIILLIEVFDESLKKSLTNFLSFNTDEVLKQSSKILILYSLLTVTVFILLNLMNIRVFDAFNLSMSIISSGGFLPVNYIDSIISSNLKKVVLSLIFLVSFFSLFLSYNIIFFKKKNLNFFVEDFYLLVYFFLLTIIFFTFFNQNNNFPSILLSITSSISNIGISFNDTYQNLSFIFLLLVIIGGSFFSTSSGVRFIKLYSLIKFSINELLSHTRPKYVYKNKFLFSETNIKIKEINKYFLTILIFIISLIIISSLLTMYGFDIETAFKLGILTIMNTVNSSMYGLNDLNFFSMSILTKITLIVFMIIGRIELLTILIISKKIFFRG